MRATADSLGRGTPVHGPLAFVVVAACWTQPPAPIAPQVVAPDPRVHELEHKVHILEAQQQALLESVDHLEREIVALRRAPTAFAPPPVRRQAQRDHAYKVPLDDSVAVGSPTAAVTLVATLQYPEPYTHRAWPTLGDLRTKYGADLRIVYKDFVVHPQATESTIGACAAGRQGQLDAYEPMMWDAAHPAIGPSHWPDAAETRQLAATLKLDMKRYDADVAGACRVALARDHDTFTHLGQAAVPEFWINGRPLSGAQPIESFSALIDEELAKAAEDRRHGGKAMTYYDRIMKTALDAP